MNTIEIYTDGSSLGNPGRGGWGAVIISENTIIKELGGCEEMTTNNRMEIKAVIEALKYASTNYNESKIAVHADSAYVLGGVMTWVNNWEKNGWKTANKKEVLNQDLWQELISLVRACGNRISWVKVKGHTDVEYNILADKIATTCAAKQSVHDF